MASAPVATSFAASKGPATRVRLFAALCRDTALGRSSAGTAFAAIAKLGGPEKAKAVPMMNESNIRSAGLMRSIAVVHESVTATAVTMA